MNALSITGSILGMVLGTASLTLSILNYLRDRAQVKVTLHWNMTDTRTGAVQGLVRVTNTGRQVVFISIAALDVPGSPTYILNDSIAGVKLAVGDKPAPYLVSHDGMEKHSSSWRKIRAFVELSTGDKFWSEYPEKDAKPPKWAVPPTTT